MVPTNLKVVDAGQDTKIDLDGASFEGQSEIEISGNGNRVVCGSGCVMKNLKIKIFADNAEVRFGDDVRFAGHILLKRGEGNKVFVGEGTSVGGARIICSEGTQVIIGSDCMLSSGIEIRSTDSHPVLNMQGERINPAANILIEDHVWLAAHVTVLKGTRIGANSMVGTRSVISGNFGQGNEAIAGNPARIVKSGVTWSRELLG